MEIPNQISAIEKIIRQDWKKIYYAATPYLDAMRELDSIRQNYYEEPAASIVRYFLANATSWRGDTARAVKAKLKQLLDE
ncbi:MULTISPECIES: hypothetical protein [unclassified Flavobacterium]|uniref:hypothetical protein n=1 Tax=unclassified Flavobacterium TaxID=196869 RepID=UPI00086C3D54|nr:MULTISPECIES: hypothetical protein [unclassified Flavobacterium]MBN9285542.1 hypothetical protein [Flavobacterium sp.]ODS81476.1 MAG: hypothetical protein ABS44_19260 [Chryseobacterium sp. SCN 40-13]OJV71098.1 MAG: hypothetical protein BGO42_04600 [Flavobacterium sp. 40-81]